MFCKCGILGYAYCSILCFFPPWQCIWRCVSSFTVFLPINFLCSGVCLVTQFYFAGPYHSSVHRHSISNKTLTRVEDTEILRVSKQGVVEAGHVEICTNVVLEVGTQFGFEVHCTLAGSSQVWSWGVTGHPLAHPMVLLSCLGLLHAFILSHQEVTSLSLSNHMWFFHKPHNLQAYIIICCYCCCFNTFICRDRLFTFCFRPVDLYLLWLGMERLRCPCQWGWCWANTSHNPVGQETRFSAWEVGRIAS